MRSIVSLDAADAKRLVDHAVAAARHRGVPQNIAVVDAFGALLAFHRMDGAKPYSAETAMAKARTSAGTHAPTATLGELALPGERGFGLNTLRAGDLTVLPGGLPITVDGAVVGAIGVSSGTVIEDAEIAGEAVTRFLNGQTAVDDS